VEIHRHKVATASKDQAQLMIDQALGISNPQSFSSLKTEKMVSYTQKHTPQKA
tara:strand:- start:41 stop:199 length:159 start_codon:yes stop_codon:yes gene_type:complete